MGRTSIKPLVSIPNLNIIIETNAEIYLTIITLFCSLKLLKLLRRLTQIEELGLRSYFSMLIYNTTYLVADKQLQAWIKWVNEEHIPFMLECGFSKPQIAKVLTADPEQDGTSLSLQFNIPDLLQLSKWDEKYGDTVFKRLAERIGTEVLAFSTVLEIL